MRIFITRIELHSPKPKDYHILHSEMEKQGFKRTVTDDKSGIEYHLPFAEYFKEGDISYEQIIESVKRAVSPTKKFFMVLVSEATEINWLNLPPVT